MSITAQIPDGAAVWQLVAFDARRFSPMGDTEVWLGVGNRECLPVRVTSIREDLHRHHFLQHLWLNLPAGTHTFELRQDAGGGGAILYRPHMALLLLKRSVEVVSLERELLFQAATAALGTAATYL